MNSSSSSSSSAKGHLFRLGLYDVQRTIGKGNFAVVKLARHRVTRHQVGGYRPPCACVCVCRFGPPPTDDQHAGRFYTQYKSSSMPLADDKSPGTHSIIVQLSSSDDLMKYLFY
ncbi:unnamed protein product [Soboliphyme baturini]|uniref:Protein kinase domain-containing protein n=1 Tax=Soboliphyme baturini TaxID=241478 RepID=A0A183IM32_9BILA|nr:unnamed protein product [Soboliphyme baturini]